MHKLKNELHISVKYINSVTFGGRTEAILFPRGHFELCIIELCSVIPLKTTYARQLPQKIRSRLRY